MIINVLATGPSLKYFKDESNLRIGVNKIIRSHYVDHLVCVDIASSFNSDMISHFKMGKYGDFHTHLPDEWKGIIPREVIKMELNSVRGRIDLDSEKLASSISSPFVAVNLAYKKGAKIIDLYGADYIDHPSFNDQIMIDNIFAHFLNLQDALVKKGITLRVSPDGILSDHLPLIPRSRMNLDIY